MDSMRDFDVFKNTKPLLVATIYAAVACFMFLLIPFLPFIETYDGHVNLIKGLFLIIEEMQDASVYLEPLQIVLCLLGEGWFMLSFLVFTVILIILVVPIFINIKKIKQFAVYGTDKIYLVLLFVLLSIFVADFFFSLLLNLIFEKSVPIIGVPNVYIVLYGALSVIGLTINFVCKNLIKPLRLPKAKIRYYGIKITLFVVLIFIAAFSSVMHVSTSYKELSLTIFSSSEISSVFVKDSGYVFVNFEALVEIMTLSKSGGFFQDIVIFIVATDVIFIFYMLLIVVYKFVSTNTDKIVDYIGDEGENVEMQFFFNQKKVETIKDYAGLLLMILGGVTLVLHIGLFPIVKLIDGIENVEFSIAPILSMFMLLFGAGIMFGTKYFNKIFCNTTDDSTVENFKQTENAQSPVIFAMNSKVDVASTEVTTQTVKNDVVESSAVESSAVESEKGEPFLTEQADEQIDEDRTSFFSDF